LPAGEKNNPWVTDLPAKKIVLQIVNCMVKTQVL